jgi:WD40 repeat protein
VLEKSMSNCHSLAHGVRPLCQIVVLALVALGGCPNSQRQPGDSQQTGDSQPPADSQPAQTIVPEPPEILWMKGSGGEVDALAVSADGEWLAASGVRLWRNGQLARTLSAGRAVAMTADGTLMATEYGHEVSIWQLPDVELLQTFTELPFVSALAFSPDMQLLASSGDTLITLRRVSDWQTVRTIVNDRTVGPPVFSPDSQTVASVTADSMVKIWRISDGEMVQSVPGNYPARFVAFSPDGQTLATPATTEEGWYGGEFRTEVINLWRVSDGQLLRAIGQHSAGILCGVFSRNGLTFASAGTDNTIRMWRVADGTRLWMARWEGTGTKYGGGQSYVKSLAYAGDDILISGNLLGKIEARRASDGQFLDVLTGHTYRVAAMAFAPDCETLATASGDIKTWRVADGQLLTSIANAGSRLTFSTDGARLMAGATDPSAGGGPVVRFWHAADGQWLRDVRLVGTWSGAITADEQTVAALSDQAVTVWRVSDGALLQTLWGHNCAVTSAVISPDGQILASSGDDRTIKFWHVADGECFQTIADGGTCVGFWPDDRTVVTSAGRLLPVGDGSSGATPPGNPSYQRVAFAPDGDTKALADDYVIRLSRVSDGQLLRIFEGETTGITRIRFSPDGRYLAWGREDATLVIARSGLD